MTKIHPWPWLMVCLLGTACPPEKPPAPQDQQRAAPGSAPKAARLDLEADPAVFTYAGNRGAFADTSKREDIPEEARGMVRVALLEGPKPPPGQVWVANLRDVKRTVELTTVRRDLFEELALGTGRKSAVDLPAGLDPPKAIDRGGIIVYKTAWCGVCKKLEAYLQRKGVEYVAKDIENNPKAAAELQAKGREAGVATGSVPVVDVRGELVVGFDRGRLEQLLGS